MPTVISTDLPLCVGCYKCVRTCPVETANVTYLDGQSHLKVRIDQTRCVSCGACLDVCPRGARHYLDDTDLVIKRLKAGDSISVLMSPEVSGNLPDYKNYIRRLKALGVNKVYNLSLGLEIHVWATMRFLAEKAPGPIIASYCPVLVSFCENHRPELIPRLSPIISPASILSMVLRDQAGVNDDLAVISACLAEAGELGGPGGRTRYSLSFSRLRELMIKSFSDEECLGEEDFDEMALSIGPTTEFGGSFSDNMERLQGPDFRCDRFFGPKALSFLDEYNAADAGELPDLLDIVVCDGGCAMGPGRIMELKRFGFNARAHSTKMRSVAAQERAQARRAFFDKSLRWEDYAREYHPSALIHDFLPEDRVNDAFLSLNKTTSAQKTVDCYACGAHSCLQMARMVALGVNIPTNCVSLAKELIAQAGQKMSDYLQLVRLIGEYTLASGLTDIGPTIEHTLMALCSSLDISRASIWKSCADEEGVFPSFSLLLSFPAKSKLNERSFDSEELQSWMEALADGEIIVKSHAELTMKERQFFSDLDLGVMALVPIMAQGDFWGMVLVARRHDHPFTREEISVIESSAFLIISTLISSSKVENSQLLGDGSFEPGAESPS